MRRERDKPSLAEAAAIPEIRLNRSEALAADPTPIAQDSAAALGRITAKESMLPFAADF